MNLKAYRQKLCYNESPCKYFSKFLQDYDYISPYSVWMRENTDQNNSEYGHFSRSDLIRIFMLNVKANEDKEIEFLNSVKFKMSIGKIMSVHYILYIHTSIHLCLSTIAFLYLNKNRCYFFIHHANIWECEIPSSPLALLYLFLYS